MGGVPAVEIVDLRAELAEGNRSIFSRAAGRGARPAATQGSEQAILLINRRGAATFVLCRDCGESLRCPDCDLPFVFHLERRAAALPSLRADRQRRPRRCPNVRQHRGSATSAPGRSGSRPSCAPGSRGCASRASTRMRWRRGAASRRSTTTSATAGSTCWSAPSSPRRGSTSRAVTLAAVIAADVTLNLPDYLAAGADVPAPRPGRRPGRQGRPAGAGADPDLRGRATTRSGRPPGSTSTASPTRSCPDAACSATRRRACWPACWWPTPDRGRAEERGRDAAAAVARPGVSRSTGRSRRMSRAAPDAGGSRSWCGRRDEAARAAALERVPPGVAIDVDPESLL